MGFMDWLLGNGPTVPAAAPPAQAADVHAQSSAPLHLPDRKGASVRGSDPQRAVLSPASASPDTDQRAMWRSFEPRWQEIRAATRPVFLTGRAGTGKSTFLRLLRKFESELNIAVVAPTAVAAINVQGATIHRFFGFKLGPIHRDEVTFSPDRAAVQRSLDFLVIDEISMVRADLLDAIDQSLQIHRKNTLPFGGVSVLMIGDLSQLPPVVVGAESDRYFTDAYSSPFFFSSRVLLQSGLTPITLTTVYRQTDPMFLGLLDRLRAGKPSVETCALLNSRLIGASVARQNSRPIVLASTNDLADSTNANKLATLPGVSRAFTAQVTGVVRLDDGGFPAPARLELKVGAKVLMTANDIGHRWINGTAATVVGFHDDAITVEIDGRELRVARNAWRIVDYEYDRIGRRLVEVERGSFLQFPCRLGWAVTIHKSQGMTLDAVDIDFGQGAFAHGQAYVAFSRCRTFEGIGLRSPVRTTDVIVDARVRLFFEMVAAGGELDLQELERLERSRVEADRVFTPPSEAHLALGDVVGSAIASRGQIEISYMDAKGEVSRRIVEPLVWKGPSMFEAFCHKAQDKRTFKVDRVTGWRSVGVSD